MGSTLSTAHRLEIRRALYLTLSNNKEDSYKQSWLRGDKVSSTAANELSQQWAVRLSKLRFSCFAGLKQNLFIQLPDRMGMTNLLLVIPISFFSQQFFVLFFK